MKVLKLAVLVTSKILLSEMSGFIDSLGLILVLFDPLPIIIN